MDPKEPHFAAEEPKASAWARITGDSGISMLLEASWAEGCFSYF